MPSHATIRRSFIHALGTAAYIVLIATIMRNMNKVFGPKPDDEVLAPVLFLLVFVVSASVTGWLVVGSPLRWYLDGKKQEAVQLLGYTVAWLALFAVLAFILMAIRVLA